MYKKNVVGLGALLCVLPCASAFAGTIGFEADQDGFAISNGTFVEDASPYADFFSLSSTGNNQGAAIFNSTAGVNNADPDLWVGFGNVLILQSNDNSSRTGNIFNTPNDAAPGGTFTFNFADIAGGLTLESIDVIDVDAGGRMKFTLFDSDNNKRIVDVPNHFTGDINEGDVGWATINLLSGPQGSPNVGGLFTTVITDAGFNANDIVKLKVKFFGSGAIDNLAYSTIIPLPPAAALGLAGFGAVALRRRMKRA